LASMIFLLYKPIIGLGPRFALAPDAGHMLCVALTAQPNNGTECLNRIYRLTANALISLSPVPVSPILLPIPFLALSHGLFSKPPSLLCTPTFISADINRIAVDFCALPHRQDFLLKWPNVR
jgi:hypothetical protein